MYRYKYIQPSRMAQKIQQRCGRPPSDVAQGALLFSVPSSSPLALFIPFTCGTRPRYIPVNLHISMFLFSIAVLFVGIAVFFFVSMLFFSISAFSFSLSLFIPVLSMMPAATFSLSLALPTPRSQPTSATRNISINLHRAFRSPNPLLVIVRLALSNRASRALVFLILLVLVPFPDWTSRLATISPLRRRPMRIFLLDFSSVMMTAFSFRTSLSFRPPLSRSCRTATPAPTVRSGVASVCCGPLVSLSFALTLTSGFLLPGFFSLSIMAMKIVCARVRLGSAAVTCGRPFTADATGAGLSSCRRQRGFASVLDSSCVML